MNVAAELEQKKKRREDNLKRQAGELPPEQDEVTGKMINPHNPDFITKKPWYLGQDGGASLQHQAARSETSRELTMSESDALYAQKAAAQRAIKLQASKERVVVFRKGACTNCGAMTHQKKDCVERPRSGKSSAWKTGLDIAPDDVTLSLKDHGKVSYTAKRDNWKGYDPDEYSETINKFNRIEEARLLTVAEKRAAEAAEKLAERNARKSERRLAKDKARRERRARLIQEGGVQAGSAADAETTSSSESESDTEPQDDLSGLRENDADQLAFQGRMARQGGVGGAQMMITARNLRIREDKPKYLQNLDMDSAHYDPKSRSMRSNPNPEANPNEVSFAGDNFQRYTGDAIKLAEQQILSWELQQRGEQIDAVANPSQMELIAAELKEKKVAMEAAQKKALADKYGNAAAVVKRVIGAALPTSQPAANTGHNSADATVSTTELDPRLRFGQSEAYQEFTKDGKIRNTTAQQRSDSVPPFDQASGLQKSRFPEDVFEGNHRSVWGSYYSRVKGEWGFACCWQTLRNSYCTGEAGKKAIQASMRQTVDVLRERRKLETLQASNTTSAVSVAGDKNSFTKRSDVYGEAPKDLQLNAERMKEAVARAERWQSQASQSSSSVKGAVSDSSNAGVKRGRGSYNGEHSVDDAIDPALRSVALVAGGLRPSNGAAGSGDNSNPLMVSQEDMEVYRLKRLKADDPMAAFLGDGNDEVLEFQPHT